MKKIVRLTEGDLHRIIKESVNNIITELDWKTKMNYVKGRLRQGDEAYRQGDENGYRKYIRKAEYGAHDANDELEKKYNGRPFRDEKGDKFRAYVDLGNGNVNTYFKGKNNVDYKSKNGNTPSAFIRGDFTTGLLHNNANNLLDNYEDNKNDVDTFRKMNKDVNDYKNGNSQYVNGKGWQ